MIEIPRDVSKFILSKLKQSRYCIILIVSSHVSINVSQRSMFRNYKNYNSEFATHTIILQYYNLVNRAKYGTYVMIYIACYSCYVCHIGLW